MQFTQGVCYNLAGIRVVRRKGYAPDLTVFAN